MLERYPGLLTLLTVRTKSGGAEMHANWNDVFVVLDGEATEMTGGTMVDRKEQADGETRGTRLEGWNADADAQGRRDSYFAKGAAPDGAGAGQDLHLLRDQDGGAEGGGGGAMREPEAGQTS